MKSKVCLKHFAMMVPLDALPPQFLFYPYAPTFLVEEEFTNHASWTSLTKVNVLVRGLKLVSTFSRSNRVDCLHSYALCFLDMLYCRFCYYNNSINSVTICDSEFNNS